MMTLVAATQNASAACELGAKRFENRGGECVWTYFCLIRSSGDTEGFWQVVLKDNCPEFDGAECEKLGDVKTLNKGKCQLTYACMLNEEAPGQTWQTRGCD